MFKPRFRRNTLSLFRLTALMLRRRSFWERFLTVTGLAKIQPVAVRIRSHCDGVLMARAAWLFSGPRNFSCKGFKRAICRLSIKVWICTDLIAFPQPPVVTKLDGLVYHIVARKHSANNQVSNGCKSLFALSPHPSLIG